MHYLAALGDSLSDTAGVDLGVFGTYLNLGVIVVVLYLAYTRKVIFSGEVEQKDQQIAKLQEAVEKYTEHYQTEVLPALIDSTRISGEIVALLAKQQQT